MNIVEIPISALKPYQKNAKKHSKAQIQKIAASLDKFKWQQPIVIDRDNVIVAGHGRIEAAKLLGLETAPCKYADELTEDEIRAYRLADNRISESEYDLNIEFEELSEIEMDMSDFELDLSDLEFQISEKEEQHKQNKENTRHDVLNIVNLEKGQFTGEGEYDIPVLEPVTELPEIKEWIGFNYVLSDDEPEGKAVHFFIDDYQFERVWNAPEKYLEKLKRYVCVATPDFSPYGDMPHALQIYNHYRKHWVGAWLQAHGVTVIPTLRPVAGRDWWLDGTPKGGIYISSAMYGEAVENETDETAPYDKIIIDRLHPKKVFMYCGRGDNLYKKYGIECEYIKSFTQQRWNK